MKGIFHLSGTVKNYDWGGFSFLPALLQQSSAGNIPFAEYWIGTHPAGKTFLSTDHDQIQLENATGPLPYLLKLLDVRQMLSIQVHPGVQGAVEGFEEENKAGVDLLDPSRNYKDASDKPELMVALSDFWLLHGFKTPDQLRKVLIGVQELSELLPYFENENYAILYGHIMSMPQFDVDRILGSLYQRLEKEFTYKQPGKGSEDFWALKAFNSFTRNGHFDRGIFSIYLFNLVQLKRTEGIFQAPGVPHAYLEGRNVEIMGNSDNVLRGGLTNKSIAIGELMKHVCFEAVVPKIISPRILENEKTYEVPTDRFHLSLIELNADGSHAWKTDKPQILLVTEGEVDISNGHVVRHLGNGHPALLITGGEKINARSEKGAMVFKATS